MPAKLLERVQTFAEFSNLLESLHGLLRRWLGLGLSGTHHLALAVEVTLYIPSEEVPACYRASRDRRIDRGWPGPARGANGFQMQNAIDQAIHALDHHDKKY